MPFVELPSRNLRMYFTINPVYADSQLHMRHDVPPPPSRSSIDPSKPILVLGHSASSSSHSWMFQFRDPRLSSALNLVAFDSRDFGWTEGARLEGGRFLTLEERADEQLEALDKVIGDRPFIFMGESFAGAYCGTWLTHKRPNQVKALIFVSPSYIEDKPEMVDVLEEEWVPLCAQNKNGNGDGTGRLPDEAIQVVKDYFFGNSTHEPERQQAFLDQYQRQQGVGHDMFKVHQLISWFRRKRPPQEVFESVRCPVLLLGGTNDRVVSGVDALLQWEDAFKNVPADKKRIERIQGGTHWLASTDAGLVNRFTLAFLKRLMSTAAALRHRAVPNPSKDVPSSSASSGSDSDAYDDELTSPVNAHLNDYPAFTPPPHSIKEILNAIPAHCFERSALRSSVYVVVDFAVIAALGYAASFIDSSFGKDGALLSGNAGVAAKWASWAMYWWWQGLVFTGVWIIGHECGHQAFSASKTINNAMGLFLHSLVLVPYHSWRISHARHHAATGHMTRDEVFVPRTASYLGAKKTGKQKEVEKGVVLDELLEDVPAYRLFFLLMQQLVGWPMYLFRNASGQLWYPKYTNHFQPSSIIFDARHRQQILLSDSALLVVFAGLYAFTKYMGSWTEFVKYYFIPYLFTNHWLVMITYLQHTDPQLPHYRVPEWNFQRGALCTMDRNMMGWIGPYILHGICETHVAHHISSKIPHYHAWEATDALKEFLGEHYHSSDENMWYSLSYRTCRYVDDEGDVLFYRDSYGRQYRKLAPVEVPSDSGVDFKD
ncbi:hypothetical protein JCM8547_003175 [Rhodosporidiobolus lusitaniae]